MADPWTWETSSPEDEGIDPSALQGLDEALRAGRHGQVDSLLVVRHDRIVHDSTYRHDYAALNASRVTQSRYFDATRFPWLGDTGLHTMQSITKSVTGLVFAIGVDRGDLPGLDTPMLEFFDASRVNHVDVNKRAVTLEHLLTMRAGFAWDETTVTYSNPANDCAKMEASDDWVAYAVSRRVVEAPGTAFRYNSGISQILSHVLRAATGRTIDDYAAQHLFGPLGIGASHWDLTPGGLPDTEGGLFLHPHDLARLGRLVLRRGAGPAGRLLSADRIATMVHPWTPDAGRFDAAWAGRGYGCQWWLLPVERDGQTDAVWTGLGFGGQRLYVVPWLDLITVFTGWNVYDNPAVSPDLFLRQLLPAVRGT